LGRVANAIGLKPSAAGKLNGLVDSITPDLSKTLAREHLSYLRERSATALRIVDKMPHNFELIGLIGLLFPKARIVHCRRDAIDNCVSCFCSCIGDVLSAFEAGPAATGCSVSEDADGCLELACLDEHER